MRHWSQLRSYIVVCYKNPPAHHAQGLPGWWDRGLWMPHESFLGVPHIFPSLWCRFAFGVRCQLPVPKGDMWVTWVGSGLAAAGVSSAHAPVLTWSLRICSRDTLRSHANFLYSVSFLLSSTPPSPCPCFSFSYPFGFPSWKHLKSTQTQTYGASRYEVHVTLKLCVMSLLVLHLGL